jgi:energy-converting hydrogenase Eha subunit F
VGHGRGAMTSTKIACIALALLALVALFPPVDAVREAVPGRWIGNLQMAGTPAARFDQGFTFIGDVGGPRVIRYQQWYSMMAAVAAIGVVGFFLAAKKQK